MTEKNEFLESFGEPISTYTDADAIEDGGLVAINGKDRVTRAVFEFLVEKLPKGPKPPNRWPVNLFTWFRADNIKKEEALKMIAEHGKVGAQKKFERMVADRKAIAAASGLIGTHSKEATRVYEQNIGGGIFKLYAVEKDGVIQELATVESGTELWLIPNENGLTLLFPSDY